MENDLYAQLEKQSFDPSYSRYYIWNSGDNVGVTEEFKDTITDAENVTYILFKSGRSIRQTSLNEMMTATSEPVSPQSSIHLDALAAGLPVAEVALETTERRISINTNEQRNESIFTKLLKKSKRKSKVEIDFKIEVDLPSVESMTILGEDFDIDVKKELKAYLMDLIAKESKLLEEGINNKLNEWFTNEQH